MKEVTGKIGLFTTGHCVLVNKDSEFEIKDTYLNGPIRSNVNKDWAFFGPSNFRCTVKNERIEKEGKPAIKVTVRCTYDYFYFVFPRSVEQKLGEFIHTFEPLKS